METICVVGSFFYMVVVPESIFFMRSGSTFLIVAFPAPTVVPTPPRGPRRSRRADFGPDRTHRAELADRLGRRAGLRGRSRAVQFGQGKRARRHQRLPHRRGDRQQFGCRPAGGDPIDLPWEERKGGKFTSEKKSTEIKLSVEKVSGVSSHARGGRIPGWLSKFESVGQVFVVHGDKKQSTGLAAAAKDMGLNATAPKNGETFTIGSDRVKPKDPPELNGAPAAMAPIDK